MKERLGMSIMFACLLVFTEVAKAQLAPVISYSTPHSYTVGSAIAALSPTNSGGAVPAIVPGVTTLAGSGLSGSANGTGTAASFYTPSSVAVDGSGNIFVADSYNHMIRKITAEGIVTTLAGNTTPDSVNGNSVDARFDQPVGITVDGAGNLYVGDASNDMIRKISSEGWVSTLAGSTIYGYLDGTGTAARFNFPRGVSVDGAGNVYVADVSNNCIRKVTAGGVVTTWAGSATSGSTNGIGAAAKFYLPTGVAADGSGNVYVADNQNHTIRRITSDRVVSTLAGTAGTTGRTDGTGAAALFNYPWGITVDGSGTVYVADSYNNLIRKVTPDGIVTTLAGTGSVGNADGSLTEATFWFPTDLAVDGSGAIYVADRNNNLIRKVVLYGYSISPTLPAGLLFDGTTGAISGTPTAASPATVYTVKAANEFGSSTFAVTLSVNGPSVVTTPPVFKIGTTTATAIVHLSNLGEPASSAYGVCWNTGGTPTIADNSTSLGAASAVGGYLVPMTSLTASTIYHIRAFATTIFGTSYGEELSFTTLPPTPSISYFRPSTYLVGSAITSLTPINNGGAIPATVPGTSNLAGGTYGTANGNGAAAGFKYPSGVAVDGSGNVFVADTYNHTIRKITPSGDVTTFAGMVGSSGSTNATGIAARFYNPWGVAVDGIGNVYVADYKNHKIRKISSDGVVTTLAGSYAAGSANGTGTEASFNYPSDVAVDGCGNVYVVDCSNHMIRKISPAGVVTTLAGSTTSGHVDATGAAARFNYPWGIEVDGSGNVYVADMSNHMIRKISPDGVVTTLAGSITSGHADGTGAAASFNYPADMAVDVFGNVYVTDEYNNLIRKITPEGVVTTLSGSTTSGTTNGDGATARFNYPCGITVDGSGNLYIGDMNNHTIRKLVQTGFSINPALSAGLSMDATSGVIQGTPSVARFATTYTVTAANAGGSNTTTTSLAVVNTLWNGAAWNPIPPGVLDDAALDGTFDGAGFACRNLIVHPGKQVTVTSGTLSLTGNLLLRSDVVNGPPTILTNGGSLSVTGTSAVELCLTGGGGATPNARFWYVSSPLTNASSSNFEILETANPLNKLWSYTEADNSYARLASANPVTLTPGMGYVARMGASKTFTLSGTALNDGDRNITITRANDNGLGTNPKRGFNLVGNPYPSYLNIHSSFLHVGTLNLETSIWYSSFNILNNLMAFDTFNASNGEQISLGTNGPIFSSNMPPMQAFWVRASTDGLSGNLALNNSMRSHQTLSNRLRSTRTAEIQKVRLQISNGQAIDQALIGFYSESMDGYDNFDSHKLTNDNALIPEIYTLAGTEKVAINSLAAPLTGQKELVLGFKTETGGSFSLKAIEIQNLEADQNVVLHDKKLHILHDLKLNPEYSFTSDSVNTTDRFSIVIGKTPTAVGVINELDFDVWSDGNNRLVVQAGSAKPIKINVYSLLGQETYSATSFSSKTTLMHQFKPGVYIVKVKHEGCSVSRKVIINK